MATPGVGVMKRILDDVDEAIAGGGLTYVHCWGGIGRTGTVVGCWLVRHGLEGRGRDRANRRAPPVGTGLGDALAADDSPA